MILAAAVCGVCVWGGCSASVSESETTAPDVTDTALPDGGKFDRAVAECSGLTEPERSGRIRRDEVDEVSGLVASRQSPGVLWSHQDHGNDTVVYATDRLGRSLAAWTLHTDAGLALEAFDAEDIAIGPGPADDTRDWLYLADIGDDDRERDTIAVLRAPEPWLDVLEREEAEPQPLTGAQRIELRYPTGDGPHDAEALLVDPLTGDLLVVTRRTDGRRDPLTVVYRAAGLDLAAAGDGDLVELERALDEDVSRWLDGRVSGADISADGRRVALVFDDGSDEDVRLFWRDPNEAVVDALRRAPCDGPAIDGQLGAIALTADGLGYDLVTEGADAWIERVSNAGTCRDWRAPSEVGRVEYDGLREISGLVISRANEDLIWVHDDGPVDRVMALDMAGNHRLDLVFDDRVETFDVEDIALGPGLVDGWPSIYLADTGDNGLERDFVRLLRLTEPVVDETLEGGEWQAPDLEVFELFYGDGEAHDAEALLVDPLTGDVVVVTKSVAGADTDTHVFVARAPLSSEGPIRLVEALDDDEVESLRGRIVAADVSADGLSIILAVKDEAHRLWTRRPDQPLWEAFLAPPCTAPSTEGQIESIGWTPEADAYVMIPEGESPDVFRVERR